MPEGVPVTISPSTIKKFRRCKRQYFYAIIEGLELRLQDPKLKAGNWMHKCLSVHYGGGDWEKQLRKFEKEFKNLMIDEREHYGDLPGMVRRMMESYLWKYGKEEEDWEILYNEENFETTFAEGDILTFKPDLVIRDHSVDPPEIWIVDHKTVRSIPSGEFRISDLQSTIYPWALAGVEGLEEVQGFIFNYIRRKAPTVPKYTKTGAISRARLDTDFPTYAKFMLQHYGVSSVNDLPTYEKTKLRTLREEHKFLRRTRLIKPDALVNRQVEEFAYTVQEIEAWVDMYEEYKTTQPDEDVWVRTTLSTCDWDCEFHDLCLIELLGQDSRFMRRAKYKPSTYIKERGLGH